VPPRPSLPAERRLLSPTSSRPHAAFLLAEQATATVSPPTHEHVAAHDRSASPRNSRDRRSASVRAGPREDATAAPPPDRRAAPRLSDGAAATNHRNPRSGSVYHVQFGGTYSLWFLEQRYIYFFFSILHISPFTIYYSHQHFATVGAAAVGTTAYCVSFLGVVEEIDCSCPQGSAQRTQLLDNFGRLGDLEASQLLCL
jgi:hypothetical protein